MAGMETTVLAFKVAARHQARLVDAASYQYRPPKWLVNGVDSGEIPSKGLLIWKYAVEKLEGRGKVNFGAAVAYWRNKCAKEGIQLAPQFQKGGPPATQGPWKVKNGDQIEDWVREHLKSEGLISDTVKTAEDWKLEISHLMSMVEDAKERIAKHEAGLAAGTRVNQRKKWLAQAKKDLESAQKEIEAANKAVEKLEGVVERHETHQAPMVDFEKQFQAALGVAAKDLSRREVLEAAKSALAAFEGELDAVEAEEEEAPPTQRTPMPFEASTNVEAGVTDFLLDGLKKVWGHITGAFMRVKSWAQDLVGEVKNIDKMLTKAGAKR